MQRDDWALPGVTNPARSLAPNCGGAKSLEMIELYDGHRVTGRSIMSGARLALKSADVLLGNTPSPALDSGGRVRIARIGRSRPFGVGGARLKPSSMRASARERGTMQKKVLSWEMRRNQGAAKTETGLAFQR